MGLKDLFRKKEGISSKSHNIFKIKKRQGIVKQSNAADSKNRFFEFAKDPSLQGKGFADQLGLGASPSQNLPVTPIGCEIQDHQDLPPLAPRSQPAPRSAASSNSIESPRYCLFYSATSDRSETDFHILSAGTSGLDVASPAHSSFPVTSPTPKYSKVFNSLGKTSGARTLKPAIAIPCPQPPSPSVLAYAQTAAMSTPQASRFASAVSSYQKVSPEVNRMGSIGRGDCRTPLSTFQRPAVVVAASTPNREQPVGTRTSDSDNNGHRLSTPCTTPIENLNNATPLETPQSEKQAPPVSSLNFNGNLAARLGCCGCEQDSTSGTSAFAPVSGREFKAPKAPPPLKSPKPVMKSPSCVGKSPSATPGRATGRFHGHFNATMYGGIKAAEPPQSAEKPPIHPPAKGEVPPPLSPKPPATPTAVAAAPIHVDTPIPTGREFVFDQGSTPSGDLTQSIKPSTIARQQRMLADLLLRQTVSPGKTTGTPQTFANPQTRLGFSSPKPTTAGGGERLSAAAPSFVGSYGSVLAEMALMKAMKRQQARAMSRTSRESVTSEAMAGGFHRNPMSSPNGSVISMNVQANSTPMKSPCLKV